MGMEFIVLKEERPAICAVTDMISWLACVI